MVSVDTGSGLRGDIVPCVLVLSFFSAFVMI